MFFSKIDLLIFFPAVIISFLGIVVIFSINPSLVFNQIVFFLLGLVCFFFLANLDLTIFKNFAPLLFIFSLFLLLLTFVLGKVTRGSVRWIRIGSLNFQSSEFVKPIIILFFSYFAAKYKFYQLKNLFLFLILLLIPDLLVFKQPDLGNAIIFLLIGIVILLARGIKKRYVVFGLIIFLAIMPLGWRFLKPYQQQRVTAFINPYFDPLGSGYHLLQSIIAVGSGGFWGKGLGMGTQSQLQFLPERHTDFIFASFAEELGFLGAIFLIVLYFILLLRILFYIKNNQDNFSALVCLGVFIMIFSQATINIGMNLGLLPVTGVTLPLFSSGGSSLVSSLIGLGLVQSAGRFLAPKNAIEIS